MKKNRLNQAFTLIELLVVITIIAILAGIALPVYSTIQERGQQTKDLAQAKQVGLGLKLYAGDNDGAFPAAGQKDSAGSVVPAISNSNIAFRLLIPDYVPAESVFFVAKSKWSPTVGDENIATGQKLVAGENAYAYVTELTETSKPRLPLLADGFSTTVGTYSNAEGTKGAVWKGKKAVVVRVDQSGAVEKCNDSFKVLGNTGAAAPADIFATSPGVWLEATQLPVNPE